MGDSFWTPGYQEEFEKKRRDYVSGYGMPSTTEQSIVGAMQGNPLGTSFVNSMNNAGLRGNNYFGPVDYGQHPDFYAKDQNQSPFSKGVDALGGWGALANIGLKGYGLYQQGQQIDDLRDWRAKLNERANASLAMDREKFGLVKQEYDTRSKKRQADMWSQRLDPASGGTANPYMSNLIQDA